MDLRWSLQKYLRPLQALDKYIVGVIMVIFSMKLVHKSPPDVPITVTKQGEAIV